MSRFRSNKERVKVHFDITFKSAENIPCTGNVYVQWKRGKKSENKGESKHVPVKDKKAIFEETMEISATLYKIPKKGYESKNISITLKEEKGKKGSSIAKTVVDLAEFAGNRDEKRSFSLKSKKSKVAPTLTIHFKSKERELAPDEDITETDNVTENSLSDDEEDVEEFTDDAHDDSSVKSGKSTSSKSDSKAEPKHDSRRDSLSSSSSSSMINLNSNDIEELRTELEKAKKREADLKKRTRELATENVDFEEKIKDLNKELDTLKKSKSASSPSSPLSPDKEAELRKRIKELSQENNDLEDKVAELQKEVEEAKQAASASSSASPSAANSEKEAQMKKRMRELATENVDLEEQVNALKKELEEVKSQGVGTKREDGSQKQTQEDLRKKIKELAQANEEAEEEVESLKKQVQQLKRSSLSVSAPINTEEIKRLQNEIHEKDDKIQDLTREVEKLKQQVEDKKRDSVSRSTDSPSIVEYKNTIASQKSEIDKLKKELDRAANNKGSTNDLAQVEELTQTVATLKAENRELQDTVDSIRDKMDSYREKLRTQQEDNDRKLQASRTSEQELRDRLRELEDAADGKLRSSTDRDRREKERADREKQEKERKAERDRYEKDLEKEREARRKAEKDAKDKIRDLEDRLEEMEAKGSAGNGHLTNGKDDAKTLSLEKELDRERDIVAAIFEQQGKYSETEGVSESALAVWALLRATVVSDDSVDSETAKQIQDRVLDLLKAACTCTPNDMTMLFYWLSTVCALLHMLRDEPDVHSNNDRDPIIDGVYQPQKEPPRTSDLQSRLEWLAFSVYKSLVSVVCNKLTPALAPLIIEKQLTDKKTHVRSSAAMRILDRVLLRTRQHYLYDAVTQQLFVQIFYFVNCHLVNTILQKDKLTPSIGFQIKLGISHLEDWVAQPSGSPSERALLAPCSAQLDGIRDVGGVLVLDKSLFADASTLQTIFRALSLRQIKRLLEVFEPDQLAQGPLPPNVRQAIATTWNNPQASFQSLLLDPMKIVAFAPQLD